MKKYLSILIALVLLFSVAACSGGTYNRKGASVAADITDYAVISNGGSAVQYGKYIYFINGYRGYTDESGNENKMGDVIKGGLYRTTLIDPRGVSSKDKPREYNFNYGSVELNVFEPSYDPVSHLQFDYRADTTIVDFLRDENGDYVVNDDDEKTPIEEDVYYANAELIVPKTVGTSGYKNGGIFIYDNYIFFASPNNNKDRSGAVQYNKTDFYVSNLSGSQTKLLYTTKNNSESSEYAFYKYAGSYYLVVRDGTNIVSVRMTSGGDIQDAKTIAQNVVSVLFPTKDIYYNFKRDGKTYSSFEYSADDFIYYTRAATKSDNVIIGQVMEVMRPNGKENLILSNDGGSVKLLNTDNGVLFYEINSSTTSKAVQFSNFHNLFMAQNSAYKAAHDKAGMNYVDVSSMNQPTYIPIDTSSFTSVRCVYPNPQSIGDVYVIGFGASSVNIYSKSGTPRTIFTGSATFVKTVEDRLYFVANDTLQYVNMYNGGASVALVSNASASPAYMFDILDQYVVFVADQDDYLKNCAKFKRIDDDGLESLFIGERTEDEEVPEKE